MLSFGLEFDFKRAAERKKEIEDIQLAKLRSQTLAPEDEQEIHQKNDFLAIFNLVEKGERMFETDNTKKRVTRKTLSRRNVRHYAKM